MWKCYLVPSLDFPNGSWSASWSASQFNESAILHQQVFSKLSHISYKGLIVIQGASQLQL